MAISSAGRSVAMLYHTPAAKPRTCCGRWERCRRMERGEMRERSSRIALRSIRATDSIPIVLDLQQRERAEHVRRIGGRRRAQVGTIELGETRHAEQAERALHLVLDELEHAHDAGLPGRRETPRRSLEHAAGDGSAAGAWSAAKCGNGAPGLRCAPSGLQIQYR